MNLFRVMTLFILVIMLSSPYAQPTDVKDLTDSLGNLHGKLKALRDELAGEKKKPGGDGKGPKPSLLNIQITDLQKRLQLLARLFTTEDEDFVELKDAFDQPALDLLKDISLGDASKVLQVCVTSTLKKFKKHEMFPTEQYKVFAEVIEQRLQEEADKDAAAAKKQKEIKDLKVALKKIAADSKNADQNLKIPETLDSKMAGTLFTDKDWSKADLEKIHGFLITKKALKSADEQGKYELLRLAAVARLNMILDDEKRAAELAAKQKADQEAAAKAKSDALDAIKKDIQTIMNRTDDTTARQVVKNFSLNGLDLKSLKSPDKAFILGNTNVAAFSVRVTDLGGQSNDNLRNLIKRLTAIKPEE